MKQYERVFVEASVNDDQENIIYIAGKSHRELHNRIVITPEELKELYISIIQFHNNSSTEDWLLDQETDEFLKSKGIEIKQ